MSARRIASAVIGAEIVLAASFGIAGLSGHIGAGVAYANTTAVPTRDWYVTPDGNAYRDVVLVSEFPGIDELPVCALEDCSDVPSALQPALWSDRDTGNAYLMWTDGPTFLVIDDTTR